MSWKGKPNILQIHLSQFSHICALFRLHLEGGTSQQPFKSCLAFLRIGTKQKLAILEVLFKTSVPLHLYYWGTFLGNRAWPKPNLYVPNILLKLHILSKQLLGTWGHLNTAQKTLLFGYFCIRVFGIHVTPLPLF